MKKLLSLIATMGIVSSTSTMVISCGNSTDSTDSQNDKTDLSKMTTKELGTLEGKTDLPTLDQIVKAINEKNANYGLTTADVKLDGTNSVSSAKLIAIETSKKFNGSVTVTYTYKKNVIKDLSTLPIKDLGNINGVGDLPSIDEVLGQAKVKNPEWDLKYSEIEFDGTPTVEKAKIKAKSESNLFSGTVEVSYKFTKVGKRDLKDLKVKDLGNIISTQDLVTSVTLDEIITAINSKNDGWILTTKDVKLSGSATKNKAKLEAVENSASFSGNVEVNYTFRICFNVSMLEDVINKNGIGGAARPNELNIGFLMVPSYKKAEIMNSFKRFVVPLLKMAEMLGIVISYDQILEVANIDLLDDQGNVVNNETGAKPVAKMKLSAKVGKENSLDGVHIKGEGNISLKTQKAVSEIAKQKELVDIKPSDSTDYTVKQTILNTFYEKNNITDANLKKQFDVTTKTETSATINTVFNSDYTPDNIDVTFKIVSQEENKRVIWDISKMSENDEGEFEPTVKITSEEKNTTLYTELFNCITNTKEQFKNYWTFEYMYAFTEGKQATYIFDNQEKYEAEFEGTIEAGTLSSTDFIKKFDTIFDINIDSSNSKIELSVKSGQENFALNGSLTLNYTK
ncbi:hypothetical protein SLITO_v1c04470 [Spiroplasma litorale]|uniref:Lipoprotein n=1 Tax=Spiroplasma litorale TaxID=216942 RepID=A0A0K1W1A0_9MOLU|nr:lipoprotein [Spiroplasma litorale]AKX34100.1 hypothetical protein SLITO_v1c04470 [Spiroplasma litorale]